MSVYKNGDKIVRWPKRSLVLDIQPCTDFTVLRGSIFLSFFAVVEVVMCVVTVSFGTGLRLPRVRRE